MQGKDNEQSLERSTSSDETLNSSSEKNQQQQANNEKNITLEPKRFLEWLQSLKLSNEKRKTLGDRFEKKKPSAHWEDLKAIRFDKEKKDAVTKSAFKGKIKEEDKEKTEKKKGQKHSGAEEKKESEKSTKGEKNKKGQKPSNSEDKKRSEKPTRDSKSRSEKIVKGTEIHDLIKSFFEKKRLGEEIKDDLKQVEKFLKDIEQKFECNIIEIHAAEVPIHGFAENNQQHHLWKGKMDCVGLSKNGTVLIIDWMAISDSLEAFWNLSKNYGGKLHQCLIYRQLMKAHLENHYKDKQIKPPSVGIMIVPIHSDNITVNSPRLFVDFKELNGVGFFKKMRQFDWKVSLPQEGISKGKTSCQCKSTCTTKKKMLKNGCPCKAKGTNCLSDCRCDEQKCQNKKRETIRTEQSKIKEFTERLSPEEMKYLLIELLRVEKDNIIYAKNVVKDYRDWGYVCNKCYN